ncbi:MAG TPA: ACT domain-containing protein [Clostridiales bacterium]|nr:ACT domain-containing protein [Clostridiales bacterium]
MIKKYLIVNKKILPEVYEKVIEARKIINEDKNKNISEAVKEVGISRSTYYKYKDYVFSPSENTIGRMAVFSMMLAHKKGVLSKVINNISDHNANILTINQTIPINEKANVNLSLDVSGVDIALDEMINNIKEIAGVLSFDLLSIE